MFSEMNCFFIGLLSVRIQSTCHHQLFPLTSPSSPALPQAVRWCQISLFRSHSFLVSLSNRPCTRVSYLSDTSCYVFRTGPVPIKTAFFTHIQIESIKITKVIKPSSQIFGESIECWLPKTKRRFSPIIRCIIIRKTAKKFVLYMLKKLTLYIFKCVCNVVQAA
jgi:hypothetical protein